MRTRAVFPIQVKFCTAYLPQGHNLVTVRLYALFPPVNNGVRTGIIGIGMRNHGLRVQIVLQIGIRQGVRKILHHFFQMLEREIPVGVVFAGKAKLIVAVAALELFQYLRQYILARFFIIHSGKPAEMVKPIITRFHIGPLAPAGQRTKNIHDRDRHIANVDQAEIIRKNALGRLRDNSGRIGVIEDPCLRRPAADRTHQLDHRRDRAHPVGKTAGAAGLLADHAVFQRDFLIHFAHFQAARPNLHKRKVNIRKRGFLICCIDEFSLRIVFAVKYFAKTADMLLPFRVVVIQHDPAKRKMLPHQTKHLQHIRRIGAAAACDHNRKLLHDSHSSFYILILGHKKPVFLSCL